MGNQIGPAPVRIAAEDTGGRTPPARSRRCEGAPPPRRGRRDDPVIFREGAHAVRGEELFLVEHAAGGSAFHAVGQANSESRRCLRRRARTSARPGSRGRAIVEEPFEALAESRRRLSRSASRTSTAKSGVRPTIERILSGKDWPPGRRRTSVEELVLLVPEVDVCAADLPQGAGNIKEVLQELGGDVPRTPDLWRRAPGRCA